MDDLEGADTPNEGDKPNQTESGVEKPTQKEEKPTVSIAETPEFRKALDEALGKGLASTNQQLSLRKAEAEKFKAEAAQHKADMEVLKTQFQELQSEYDRFADQQYADEPEARKAFLDRKDIADKQRLVAKREAEAEQKYYEAEKLAWSVRMAQKAQELHTETGIEVSELEECQTEEEMEVKALRFQLTKPPEEKPVEQNPPVFAGAGGFGGGMNTSKMSPDDLLREGFKKIAKK